MTRSRGSIDSIVRYPVKGLSGVPARDPVRLDPGRGLRGDRAFAIARRDSTPSSTGWLSREHFFHLARHEHLARISLGLVEDGSDSPALVVETAEGMARGKRGSSLAGEVGAFDSAAIDDLLRRTLGADHGEPRLVEAASDGLWDWEDAHLSIINLATLEELERETGVPVDRRRFRANLYLTGLAPFEEFELVGARIRVGEAELEVFQPTDRCRATTIRPVEGVSDLNVPALLASRYGYAFCGVYARVIGGGTVRVGDARGPRGARGRRTSGRQARVAARCPGAGQRARVRRRRQPLAFGPPRPAHDRSSGNPRAGAPSGRSDSQLAVVHDLRNRTGAVPHQREAGRARFDDAARCP